MKDVESGLISIRSWSVVTSTYKVDYLGAEPEQNLLPRYLPAGGMINPNLPLLEIPLVRNYYSRKERLSIRGEVPQLYKQA